MPKTKRNHYIPQAYLRHFASPNDSEKVHVFDKESERWMLTNVLNAGVWNDFYSDEDEKRLSDEIEFPANFALAKLRGGQCIDADERLKVALYLESMIKRVPSTRRELLKGAPNALEQLSPNPPKDTDGRREDRRRGMRELQGRWPGLDRGRWEVGGGSSVTAQAPNGRLRELGCAGWQ